MVADGKFATLPLGGNAGLAAHLLGEWTGEPIPFRADASALTLAI